jgi:hypothetical protein
MRDFFLKMWPGRSTSLSASPILSSPAQRLFLVAVLTLSGLSLLAVWYPRFPAMQDYPQHLFMAHVLTSYDSPLFNWRDYYDAHYLVGPYSLFFLVVGLMENVMPIESAGKAFITVTLCLLVVLVFVWNFAQQRKSPAWSLLLLFPLFFSQMYYMGFTNYLISIPLLFLALYLHERIVKERTSPLLALMSISLVGLLFLSHPYSILVFIVLAAVLSARSWDDKQRFYISLLGPLFAVIIFSVWYASTFDDLSVSQQGGMYLSWIPLPETLKYFLLPFVGMRWGNGPDLLVLSSWLAVVCVFIYAFYLSNRAFNYRSPVNMMLGFTILGYLVMPFYVGDYSYFNLRMSMVVYFLMILALTNVELGRYAGGALFLLTSIIMLGTINKQMLLSAETEELLPLLQQMEQNNPLAAIYGNASANGIDNKYFYQFHAHDHFYYHIAVGGGAAASVFPSKLNPVNFKKDIVMPDVSVRPNGYRYILVRGEQAEKYTLRNTHKLKASSAPWALFERF